MYDISFYVFIGSFRKVAELSKDMTVSEAMLVVAKEIEEGIAARESGLTRALTAKDLAVGKFIGELK